MNTSNVKPYILPVVLFAVLVGLFGLLHAMPSSDAVLPGTASIQAGTDASLTAADNAALARFASSTPAQLALWTDAEWKLSLAPDQYSVLKEGGTEVPFTSPLLHEERKGTFVTADCGEPVFRSETKFDSGTGWPSFWAPIKGSVIERTDSSLGMTRTEVVSAICHSHLGHVFHDAPQTPTGDRYCMNGVALIFIPDKIQ